jgi:ferrochelatase
VLDLKVDWPIYRRYNYRKFKVGKHIVLVPIAFVSEHSETLVELDIEYKEIADRNGCKNYTRIPALGTNENYIKQCPI